MPDEEVEQPLDRDECATTLPSMQTPPEKSQFIGPYKLLQKLGEGGMGTVWMAEQESPIRRRVAVKVIKAGLDNKQVIARFEAERQALAMMNHENIAKILDVGTSANGQPYFVMELVQGIPFNKWCDTNKLSINERLELFIPVCKATQHAHQKGIIHRDLKPSNVLVCLYDGRPVPKIIDFGLAKALGPNTKLTDKTMFTEFGQVVGTLQYMSPEQAEMNQLDIDTRTDIYSLGVMLYELLTGSTPIDQNTLKSVAIFKILESIRETDPPRPSARLSSFAHEAVSGISAQRRIDEHKLKSILRGELDWIVMKSIEKNRCRRYETANDFAEDILHYLNNEVVKAKPPSRLYRLEKSIRKHKGLVASLCMIAILLTGAAAISGWFAFQANAAKVVAERKTDEALLERQTAIAERSKADIARKEASINEELAKQRAQEALEQAKNAKKQLVRFYVANGVRFGENGSPWESLSWYAKAWESEPEKDFASDSAFRTRIGAVLADTPRLAAVFFHENMVFDAVISPDGTRLLTLPEADEAWLYDVASQAPVARLKHEGTVLTAAFSPDGAAVVTGGNDKKVKLWNSEDGTRLGNELLQSAEVRSIDFHPTLPVVVTGAGEVGIWDIRTGQQVALNEAPKKPWYVKFSRDGEQLLVAYERYARVWSTSDWRPVGPAIKHSGLAVNTMIDHLQNRTPSRDKPFPSLSPDGKKLAVFGTNGTQVIDLVTGDLTRVTGEGTSINSASFSSDGKQLLVCGFSQKVSIYDTESWKLTNSFSAPRAVLQAAWHPSLPIIVATSAGGVTHLISAVTGKPIAPQLKHAVSTSRVSFSPDGIMAVVADLDGTVRLWELHGSSCVENVDKSRLSSLSPSLSPDRMLRAKAVADDLGIVLVDAQSGRTVSKTPSVDEATEVLALDRNVLYSPDGNFILTVSNSDLHIWSAKDCKRIATVSGAIDESDPMRSLRFSKDGLRFLTVDGSRKVGIFETSSGNPVGPRIPADDSELRVVAISSDGTKWAMGGNNSQVDVFDAFTGRKLISVTHRGYISGISFSSNDKLLATASLDNTCRVWDVQTGRPVSPPLRHEGYAWDVKFNPNGVQVATCGKDNTIRLWDIRTGQPLMPPISNSGNLIEFSPEGDSIFYVAPDGKYSRWNLPKFAGSPSSITYLARLFTGRFVDDTDGFTEVEKSEFRDHLATYRSAWFEYLNRAVPSTPTESPRLQSFPEPIQTWHKRNAEIAEARQDWFAATFHLGRLTNLAPEDPVLQARFQRVKTLYQTSIGRLGERVGLSPHASSATASADGNDAKSHLAQERLLALNESLWARVSRDHSENAPPLAVSEIEEFRDAVAAQPLGTYFNTLATAEYRLGNYEASISAAIKSIELTPTERGLPGPHPIDLAILAMSHYKLGNAAKSKTYRLFFENAMKMERWKSDSDCLIFANELNELLSKGNK